MRRQFSTLGKKLAGDFLPKVREGENHSLCQQGVVPYVLMMHFRLLRPKEQCIIFRKRGFDKRLYDSE